MPVEVPTISVEPPRNPQQMDKAVRGLVEGRYEWIAFTSVNAVKAVREKFEEYGLDARAFSGLKVAAVGEKTAEALAAWGLRADLVPSGEQSRRRACSRTGRRTTSVLDPINRVFLPRADIATETLVAGLVDLGWEVDDVTAYRTVRAAPPPAPVREAIKTGGFDAVLFTSSLDRAQPGRHRRQAARVDRHRGASARPRPRPPRSTACASTCWRRAPSVEALVDALADFGASRAAAMVEAGQPVAKPSSGVPRRRRKAELPEAMRRSRRPPTSAAAHAGVAAARSRRRTCGPASWCCRCSSREGATSRVPIRSMPGVVQHTRESLRKAAAEAVEAGVGGHDAVRRPAAQGRRRLAAPLDPDGILNVALRDVRRRGRRRAGA